MYKVAVFFLWKTVIFESLATKNNSKNERLGRYTWRTDEAGQFYARQAKKLGYSCNVKPSDPGITQSAKFNPSLPLCPSKYDDLSDKRWKKCFGRKPLLEGCKYVGQVVGFRDKVKLPSFQGEGTYFCEETHKTLSSFIYTGAWHNNVPNGFGVSRNTDQYHAGYYENSLPHGQGHLLRYLYIQNQVTIIR